MPGPSHPRDRIVELASFPSRFEADVVIGMLESNGIRAMGDYGDGDGWAPNLALFQGARVLVFDADVARAEALLAAASPLEDPTEN
jgi:hypothetical protein